MHTLHTHASIHLNLCVCVWYCSKSVFERSKAFSKLVIGCLMQLLMFVDKLLFIRIIILIVGLVSVNYDLPAASTITESDGPPKSYCDFLVLYPTQGGTHDSNILFLMWCFHFKEICILNFIRCKYFICIVFAVYEQPGETCRYGFTVIFYFYFFYIIF